MLLTYHILFKYLLNNYKNFIYLNSTRVKINLWSFVHIYILYTFQRTSIMVWLNTIEGLSSRFIKVTKGNVDFINLYKKSITYVVITVVLLLLCF